MLNDRRHFLQAIADNPADDFPRLVYADWLEEHGEAEHAELIRVACEREKQRLTFGVTTSHGRYGRLVDREQQLLARACGGWAADHFLPHNPETNPRLDGEWDRGMVVSVRGTGIWCKHYAQVVSQHHPLHAIRLTDWHGLDASLPPNPAESLPWLKRLELPGRAFIAVGEAMVFDAANGPVLNGLPGVEVSLLFENGAPGSGYMDTPPRHPRSRCQLLPIDTRSLRPSV